MFLFLPNNINSYDGKPKVLRTKRLAIWLNSSRFSRHIMAASTLAPDSSLGSAKGKLNVLLYILYKIGMI